jgi:hypothetical protein
MFVQYVLNGGVAEVDDEFGAELVASGSWVVNGEAVKPARKPRAARAETPAPVEEPQPEE